jgi:ElaB/YqjD/DUF883 family membrane-anchored ribosome-binding protein
MGTNGSRVGDESRGGMEQMTERFGEQMESFREYAGTADEAIRRFARERPLAAVGIAIGVGFLLGRLASRT